MQWIVPEQALKKYFNAAISMDFEGFVGYNGERWQCSAREVRSMNENEAITKWEDRFTEEKQEVANMDRDDFLDLLMESRIIQAS